MNDFKKWFIFLNVYSGFSLPASKMVAKKCFKLISNHSGIIYWGLFSPFQGSLTHRGLWPWGLRNYTMAFYWNFESFCLNSFEWMTLLNILYSIGWIFWMNFLDFVLNSIWIWPFFGPIQWKNEFSKKIAQPYSGYDKDPASGYHRKGRVSSIAQTPNIRCFVAKLHLSQFKRFFRGNIPILWW